MVPANRENAKTAQQIKITRAIAIVEVLAFAFLEPYVIPDRFEHPHELLIQVPRMHGTTLRLTAYKHLGNV